MPPRTRGLDDLGRALVALGREPGLTVARFAAALDLPRSSAFALVKHLENSAIVERDAAGLIWPGSGAAALGFGALGVAGLEGAVDALAGGLCEALDATVELLVGKTALVSRRASWDRKGAAAGPRLDAAVGGRARLCVCLRATASEAEVCEARRCLQRTAQALSDHLAARRTNVDGAPASAS